MATDDASDIWSRDAEEIKAKLNPNRAKPRNVAFAILDVYAISDGVVYAGHPAGGEFLTIGLFGDMPINQGDQIMIRIDKINKDVAV